MGVFHTLHATNVFPLLKGCWGPDDVLLPGRVGGVEEWTGSLRRVLDKANQRSTKSTFGFKLVRDRKHDHKPLKWGEKSGKSPLF